MKLEKIEITSGADVLLALLYAPGKNGICEEIRGNTRLMKLMYILEKETDLKEIISRSLHFEAYDYGPYSQELFDIVEALMTAKIIDKRDEEGDILEFNTFLI